MESSSKIRRLTEVVINQINAGEVVERPSNVVKELIENSLDAGATQIEISLKEGGMREILVKDDGSGIPSSELALAVERHATSKLRGIADLQSVSSFGFRGEALAAISSVSNMTVRSSTDSSDGGAEIRVDFGVPSSPFPCRGARGTSISVMDLFERVPARKKYLRSVQTELTYAARVVKECALAYPEVTFQLYHQGELLHAYPANDLRARFWTCLKPQWEPIEIVEEQAELRLHALLSPPDLSAQRNELYLFINRRSVKNRTLMAAVRNAYVDLLGKGHEPTGAVFLSIAFDRVDVNAHPQKLEVRCLGQEKLYSWIYHTIGKKLAGIASVKEPGIELLGDMTHLGKCIGRLGSRYLIYVDSEGINVLDPQKYSNRGRDGKYRLGLSEIEKFFNP